MKSDGGGRRGTSGRNSGGKPVGKLRGKPGAVDTGAAQTGPPHGASASTGAHRGIPRRLSGPLLAVAVLALLAAGVLVRVVPAWSTVFAGQSGVRLFDTDSYYHLRHARFAAAHFPTLQRWDPGVYPEGQPRRYAGLFDIAIGGAALVAGGGHPDAGRVTRVAAFTPVALGVLACLALFFLTKAAAGPGAGLLALALVTLYPGTFVQRSLLGAVDHHVAEVLLAVLTAWGLHRALRPPPASEGGRRWWRWWRPDFLAATPLVLFFFTWYGAPIYLVLVAATFFVVGTVALLREDPAAANATAGAAFRYGAGVVLAGTAAALVMPWLVMEAAILHKALLAAALFTLGLPAYLAGMATVQRRLVDHRPRQKALPVWLALAGTAIALAAVWAAVQLVPNVRQLMGSLFDVKTNMVKEQAGISVGSFAFLGGAPAFLAIAALPLAWFRVWRHRTERAQLARDEARLALTLFATLVVAMWLRTHDYGYVAPPLLAWLATDVLARAWQATRSTRLRIAGGVAVGAAVLLPLLPSEAVAPIAPTQANVRDFMILRTGWEQALAWMNVNTPPLAVPLSTPVPKVAGFRHPVGNYGVQAFWDFGHFIAELGERPPVASGGISTSIAGWFLLTDEEQAVQALAKGRKPGESVRYVIADAQTAGDFVLPSVQMTGGVMNDYVQIFVPGSLPSIRLARFTERYARSMVARLYEGDGDGLGHFRMVYASPDLSLLAFHAPQAGGKTGEKTGEKTGGPIVRKATPFVDAAEQERWRQHVATARPVVLPDEIVYDGAIGPSVKIFQQVAGARLAGQAGPGALVEARIELRARAGNHKFRFHRGATADVTGHFELVVPYPTEQAPADSDVIAGGAYKLHVVDGSDRAIGVASVSTNDVEAGTTVAVTATP